MGTPSSGQGGARMNALYRCKECQVSMSVVQASDGDGVCHPCRVVLRMERRLNEQRVMAEAERIARAVW